MRVLLDECLPKPLAALISGHDAETVPNAGWAGIKNGELLALAADNGFEVFVTVDQNLAYQQNLASYPLGVVVLRSASNRLADLKPLVPELIQAIEAAKPGSPIIVGGS